MDQKQVELRISGASSVTALEALVSEDLGIDMLMVIDLAPESIDAGSLAALLPSLPKPVHTETLAEACVRRAEAVDRWTGRLDQSIAWLQAIINLKIMDPEPLCRTLGNAQFLGQLLVYGVESLPLLEEVDAMTDHELVAWALRAVGNDPERAATTLDLLGVGGRLHTAWNRWWSENMQEGEVLLPTLLAQHPAWFTANVVLAAVYSVGGACSCEPPEIDTALGCLEQKCTVVPQAMSVELPAEILGKLTLNPSAEAIMDAVGSSDSALEDLLPKVVSAGRAQARVVRELREHTTSGGAVDMGAVAVLQGDAGAQQRFLDRVLGQRLPSFTGATLETLIGLGLFAALGREAVWRSYLHSLLVQEQYEAAQLQLERGELDVDGVRETVCMAAQELFDNADTGDQSSGLLGAAQSCLDILPTAAAEHPDVQVERQLIEAAHLVWRLGGGGRRLLFVGAEMPSVMAVLPIELRLGAADPYELLRLILERYPRAFGRQREMRAIAVVLLRVAVLVSGDTDVGSVSDPEEGRDLGVHTTADALLCALLVEAAMRQGEYSEAYGMAKQLFGAHALLMQTAAQASDEEDSNGSRSIGERAVERVWQVCARLAEAWVAGDADRRAQAAGLALALCPAARAPEILALWTAVQPDPGVEDPAAEIQSLLVGTPTAVEVGGVEEGEVDLDLARTFDPAIIRRALRLCGGSAEQRGAVLVAWLEFALTTAKEPKDADAQEFCAAAETEIVAKYAARALRVLEQTVWSQMDQTNYPVVQRFLAVYKRLLEAEDRAEDGGQVACRLEIVDTLRRNGGEVRLGALVACVTEAQDRVECARRLATLFSGDFGLAAGLAPALERLQPIAELGDGGSSVARDQWELASALCRVQVEAVAADSAEFRAFVEASAAQLTDAGDREAVANVVAFGLGGPLGERQSAVEAVGQRGSGAERALAYLRFAGAVDAMRDPFTFGQVQREPTKALEDIKPDAVVVPLVVGVVGRMAVAGQAYFACQTYVAARELAAAWGEALPELDAVYAEAVVSAGAALAGDASQAVLDLCSFGFGEGSALDAELQTFRPAFLKRLERLAYEPPAGDSLADGPRVDSGVRLALLRVCRRHQVERANADELELQLMARHYWGIELGDESRAGAWSRLLEATCTDEQAGVLVGLLESWGNLPEDCVGRLITKAAGVEERRFGAERVVLAMCEHPQVFPEAAGRVFPGLLAGVRGSAVAAAAMLALAFPRGAWEARGARLAMDAVQAASEGGDEEGDAWGIDDVDDLDEDAETRVAARDAVLGSPVLHVLLVARGGYIGECGPELLNAVEETLFGVDPGALDVGQALVPNGDPMAELVRRAVHVFRKAAGMDGVALAWVFRFLEVPEELKAGADTERWVKRLDEAVGEPDQDPGEPGEPDQDPGEPDQDPGEPEEPLSKDSGQVPDTDDLVADEADAWGDDDDLDLDFDLQKLNGNS